MKNLIFGYLDKERLSNLREILSTMNVVDVAQLFEEMPEEKKVIVFRILPKDIAADVFSYMSPKEQQFIIEGITDKEIGDLVQDLYLDDTVDFIEELPANVVKRVLKNTDTEKRKLINQFLNYPENSAGSIMTIEYVNLHKSMTVREAISRIKEIGIDSETIDTCYVTSKGRILEGVVLLRKLILGNEDSLVEDLMDKDVKHVATKDDQEAVAKMFKKYDLLSMPVVDDENRLVGIITIDDVIDIIEQENTEDFQKMAAMAPSEEEYLNTSVFNLAKHRIIWLLVLMISATFTGSIIRKYEDVLQSVVILASFIPMLMDTGGNAGSQSSTLIIRGLALGEITLKDWFKVMRKELSVSVVVGVVLSVVNFLRIYYLEGVDSKVALTVSITLFFVVIIAKVVGGLLPIGAKKLKLDPAIMASPLITTIVDALALMIYFTAATFFLGI